MGGYVTVCKYMRTCVRAHRRGCATWSPGQFGRDSVLFIGEGRCLRVPDRCIFRESVIGLWHSCGPIADLHRKSKGLARVYRDGKLHASG